MGTQTGIPHPHRCRRGGQNGRAETADNNNNGNTTGSRKPAGGGFKEEGNGLWSPMEQPCPLTTELGIVAGAFCEECWGQMSGDSKLKSNGKGEMGSWLGRKGRTESISWRINIKGECSRGRVFFSSFLFKARRSLNMFMC